MTHDQIIAVIRAHQEGKKVELQDVNQNPEAPWIVNHATRPIWDFNQFTYRIAREPRKCWVAWTSTGTCAVRGFETISEESATRNGWQLVTEQL